MNKYTNEIFKYVKYIYIQMAQMIPLFLAEDEEILLQRHVDEYSGSQ